MVSDQPPVPLRDYFDGARIALALASAGEDTPLVLINKPFIELTGYGNDDALGRNCRFLQGRAHEHNAEPRARIKEFLASDRQATVRTPIVNFRKNGSPFVNVLYMSKLRDRQGGVRFYLASQFDISRSEPQMLEAYDRDLGKTLEGLAPIASESGMVLDGSLTVLANSAATIAQAKLTLAELSADPML